MEDTSRDRLCPTIGDDVLSMVYAAMIEDFTVEYAFNFGEFLDREMRDMIVGGRRHYRPTHA